MKKALYLTLLLVLVTAGLTAVASCGTSPPLTPTPTGNTPVKPTGTTPGPDYKPAAVIIENFAFSPAVLTVPVGTTVTWTNQDSVQHTVTERESLFDSGLLSRGESFSRTFNDPGEYDYYCIPHPYMTGKVIVE
jgi:plastocyanin